MFGIADYGAFCAAILVFLALPGPGTFALLTSTAKGGMRAGAAATFGVIAGDQVLLWLAVAGVAALLAAHPLAFQVVQVAGAVYLAWIGLRLLLARPGQATPIRIAPRHYARQAFLITLLNPKAIVFYMAFFPLFIDPVATPTPLALTLTFVAMALTISVLTFFYGSMLVFLGAAIARAFSRNRLAGRIATRLAGVCLIGFGVRLSTN